MTIMEKKFVVEEFEKMLVEIESLEGLLIEAWKSKTIIFLEDVFGKENEKINQLKQIKYEHHITGINDFVNIWNNLEICKTHARAVIEACIRAIKMSNSMEKHTIKKFNLYCRQYFVTYNILNITEAQLNKVIKSYNDKSDFSLRGERFSGKDIDELKIYTYDNYVEHEKYIIAFENEKQRREFSEPYFPKEVLAKWGKDVTEDYLDEALLLIDDKKDVPLDEEMESLKNRLRNLISKDDIEDVFDELDKIMKPGTALNKEVLQLSGRNNNAERKNRKGIISHADFELETNKIRDTLLSVVHLMKRKDLK